MDMPQSGLCEISEREEMKNMGDLRVPAARSWPRYQQQGAPRRALAAAAAAAADAPFSIFSLSLLAPPFEHRLLLSQLPRSSAALPTVHFICVGGKLNCHKNKTAEKCCC